MSFIYANAVPFTCKGISPCTKIQIIYCAGDFSLMIWHKKDIKFFSATRSKDKCVITILEDGNKFDIVAHIETLKIKSATYFFWKCESEPYGYVVDDSLEGKASDFWMQNTEELKN